MPYMHKPRLLACVLCVGVRGGEKAGWLYLCLCVSLLGQCQVLAEPRAMIADPKPCFVHNALAAYAYTHVPPPPHPPIHPPTPVPMPPLVCCCHSVGVESVWSPKRVSQSEEAFGLVGFNQAFEQVRG
jgi:hypothetical protein